MLDWWPSDGKQTLSPKWSISASSVECTALDINPEFEVKPRQLQLQKVEIVAVKSRRVGAKAPTRLLNYFLTRTAGLLRLHPQATRRRRLRG